MKTLSNCENGKTRVVLTHKQVLNICDNIINNNINNDDFNILKCDNTTDEKIKKLSYIIELSLCYGTTNKKFNSKLRAIYKKFSKIENLSKDTKASIKGMNDYLKVILDMDNLHKSLGID